MATIAELLDLVAYEPKEIEAAMPRVRKVFDRLGLTPEDIAQAIKRLTTYYDMDLLGVRKIIGIMVKELVDVVLADEDGKRLVGLTIPSIGKNVATAAMMGAKDLICSTTGCLFVLTLGAVFGKMGPVFAAGEKLWLGNPSTGHCGYNVAELGILLLDLAPRPGLVIHAGFPCDLVPKHYEFISRHFGIPTLSLNMPMDQDYWEDAEELRRVAAFTASEYDRACKRLGDFAGLEITEDKLEEARRWVRDNFSNPMAEITQLLRGSDPTPTRSYILNYLHFFSGMGVSVENMEVSFEAVKILRDELKQRVSREIGIVPKGSPRVYCEGWPPYGEPAVSAMAEDLGITLAVFDRELCGPDGRLGADTRGTTRFAESFGTRMAQRTSWNHYQVRANSIIGACKRWDLDGVFWFNHSVCRAFGLECWMLRDLVQEKVKGMPYLIIDGADYWDPRTFRLEMIKARLEDFAQMAKSYKASKAA